MSRLEQATGSCLCGGVRFVAHSVKTDAGACHCGMCRKVSGGIFMAASAQRLAFVEKETLDVFVSSEWGERGFCRRCGSTLFWRLQDGSHIEVALGAFDDPAPFTLTHEVFIEAKPAGYDFAQDTQKLTEAELLAAMKVDAKP